MLHAFTGIIFGRFKSVLQKIIIVD